MTEKVTDIASQMNKKSQRKLHTLSSPVWHWNTQSFNVGKDLVPLTLNPFVDSNENQAED